MKVSDLILELQEFYQAHGDMPVTIDVANANPRVMLEDPILESEPRGVFYLGEKGCEEHCVMHLMPTPDEYLQD